MAGGVGEVARRRDGTLWMARGLAGVVGLFFAGMVVLFMVQSWPAFRHAGLGYLTEAEWFFRAQRFGTLPMIYGTVSVAAIALLLAAPLGLGAALFTAEVLPHRWRTPVTATIQLLAGVPSVVSGLLGVLLLRDWVLPLLAPWEPLSGDTLFTGGVLLAVMILPTVATLSDDALRAVPARARVAARALGMTRAEVVMRVALPQAASGLSAAVLLALGRALGETIAVFLVIGRQDNQWPDRLLSVQPLAEAGQTLTTKLGGPEIHLAYGDSLHWGAMIGLALVLLALTLTVSLVGTALERRGRA